MYDACVMDVSDSFEDHSEQRDDDAGLIELFLFPKSHEVLAWEILSDKDIMRIFFVEFLE
jgi:hypothetical protein